MCLESLITRVFNKYFWGHWLVGIVVKGMWSPHRKTDVQAPSRFPGVSVGVYVFEVGSVHWRAGVVVRGSRHQGPLLVSWCEWVEPAIPRFFDLSVQCSGQKWGHKESEAASPGSQKPSGQWTVFPHLPGGSQNPAEARGQEATHALCVM